MQAESGGLPEIEHRAADLVGRMTLEEKAALTVGRDAWTTISIERLGIPSIRLSDGPTGVRKVIAAPVIGLGTSVPATCFPTESCLGATWDVDLVREVGRAIGRECQATGVQVLLGPGVGLKRSPLCGRNFEYFSEDPALSGELAAAYIDGVQQEGVGTSLKHYVANECETDRLTSDSIVDERTLRELYLRPFEIAVTKAQPWTLMAAYSRLNGPYCTESRYLLRDLPEEWGYQGIFVSDWFAVDDRVASLAGGLHLQMPAAPTAQAVVDAVRDGRLDEAQLDALIRRLLAFILKADAARRPSTTVDFAAHHGLARRAAGEGMVLLKNEGGLLPLAGDSLAEIALLGAFAQEPRFQGAGSSQVNPTRVETLYDEATRLLGTAGHITFARGYDGDAPDPTLLQEAQETARHARAAVVIVGLPVSHDSEGGDRTSLDLPPSHNALVEAVLAVQPRTVVVLQSGAAVAMPWADRVPAIIQAWLGGQGGGGALADILLGRVSPSGKLGETFPARLEDTPAYLHYPDDGQGRAVFAEGLFTGYRWYDARKIEPLFPFGHGLSYTSFSYSNIELDRSTLLDTETLALSLTVRNTGRRAGREIVQIYVREQRPRLRRPEQELKAFASVMLEPGEARVVRFTLSRRDFAFFDPQANAWTVTAGTFDILAGASSREIRLRASVAVRATQPAARPHFDRYSRVETFMAYAEGRAFLGSRLSKALLGPETGEAEPETPASDEVASDPFLLSLPIGRLVVLGTLTEQEMQAIVDCLNADD